jgi:hypothetical protein
VTPAWFRQFKVTQKDRVTVSIVYLLANNHGIKRNLLTGVTELLGGLIYQLHREADVE